jgi:hypothetical protein
MGKVSPTRIFEAFIPAIFEACIPNGTTKGIQSQETFCISL